ncbi:ArsR/SmtB family transcription factor [Microcella alkaliphila]|jgi:DNA-binding transcriptional ArsR family regulator|uniref:Transcriptional regulator, ArsR family n=1 Tax=Microcella alkaliphila TaxID=279828 RepID=A0A0U4NSH9_9MICO|nr:metalloregulator ArsR/SmtB family transcription factor [Microcella alkaliphila]BAU31315.1 transcriptional regulator, ArsR family [Microcella alkaliphila]
MADIFTVIADATRRELLGHLLDATLSPDNKEGELAVSELVDRMDATQPTVSKHLKVLRDIGLVQVREEGQHRYYRLDSTPLEDVEDFLIPFLTVDFDEEHGEGGAAFAAWAGVDLTGPASTIGRAAADASHQARTVIHEAQERLHVVGDRLHDAQETVVKRLPWRKD